MLMFYTALGKSSQAKGSTHLQTEATISRTQETKGRSWGATLLEQRQIWAVPTMKQTTNLGRVPSTLAKGRTTDRHSTDRPSLSLSRGSAWQELTKLCSILVPACQSHSVCVQLRDSNWIGLKFQVKSTAFNFFCTHTAEGKKDDNL